MGISGKFFGISFGLGPFRFGVSSGGGGGSGPTFEGLVWFGLFSFVGIPILAALFEAVFFIVFVLLLSLVLIAASCSIFEIAVYKSIDLMRRYMGYIGPILNPLINLALGIPTAAIYLLCLYQIPLVGRDWDYPNRIENCPKWLDTNVCEHTGILGFADINQWIMALGACVAYILTVLAVGFALRKKWLPWATSTHLARELQVRRNLPNRHPLYLKD
jgi:hypothetical protein